MPLPANGTPWPPKPLERIFYSLQEWDAWYSGDREKLAEVYRTFWGAGPVPRGAQQLRGGIFGRMSRWFWGQPMTDFHQARSHVPIAADICQAGADLLYAEPPTFTVEDSATQDRLDELGDDTLHSVLAESAEIGGALGGSYLRVTWDKSIVPDRPFLTTVDSDAAVPEFRWGRLTAVTFWHRVRVEGGLIWRHLERHELDSRGFGVILHGLYRGGEGDIGVAVPLADDPSTAPLAALVQDGNMISTESPGLAVAYVPNQRPNRKWRNDPIGRNLGRSDLDGVEHMMDELDEIYTSWMRDIRLGKARVFVAESVLQDNGPGRGASWNADQEIYAPLNLLANRTEGGGLPIQAEQFAIRTAEHQASAQDKIESILRTAGYSTQTFGLDSDTGRTSNLTATEVQARERRSYLTRDRKIRLQGPAVKAITAKLLAVDRAIFNTPNSDDIPNVAFADSAQESALTMAQTALALSTAQAASTKTLVSMIHPDWDEDAIDKEIALIHGEQALSMPVLTNPDDPSQFGPPQGDDPAGSGTY